MLSWTGVATAEGAPPAPQWSAPPPSTAPAAPPASAPPPPAAAPSAPAAAPSAPAPSAPAAAPSAPAPLAPPAGVAPAAAPYPYAYPYPAYPAPPPPGYPYGYYYPPPAPELPRPRFPDNSAVSSTPFIEALVLGVAWENRISDFLNVGAQVGVFVAGRVRLTLRGAIPTDSLNDEYDANYNYNFGYARSKSASLLYGASAGIVAVGTRNFALSPGLAFARSDVSDYGTMIALSMPLEWVLANGLRVGFEVDLGRAVGGRADEYSCVASACSGAQRQSVDRPAGTAFWMQFQLGYGFNHPAPLAPASSPAGP